MTIGVKNKDNRQWRIALYSKLVKLGFKQKPSFLCEDGYIVISPEKEFYNVPKHKFDAFMFDGFLTYEARNEVEFIEKAKEIFLTPNIMAKEKNVKQKLPTVEEFLLKKESEQEPCRDNIKEWIVEFAKLHVTEAIEKASKGFKNADNIRYIKKCYPLDGIV